jgi:hypothetical protein
VVPQKFFSAFRVLQPATIKRLKNTGLVPKKILSAEHLFQTLLGQSVRSEVRSLRQQPAVPGCPIALERLLHEQRSQERN